MYEINKEDNNLIKYAKNELNILYKDIILDDKLNNINNKIINIVNILNDCDDNEKENIFLKLNKLLYKRPLSHINLNKNNFIKKDNILKHNRYDAICIDTNNKIYNKEAFKYTIEKVIYEDADTYINNDVSYNCLKSTSKKDIKIYLSKGGVLTGHYINKCYLFNDIIKSEIFVFQSIINLKCNAIIFNDNRVILIIDHRNKKLSTLKKFYNVDIAIDNKIKEKHIDIRKFNSKSKN